jgi:hypothetical protein
MSAKSNHTFLTCSPSSYALGYDGFKKLTVY